MSSLTTLFTSIANAIRNKKGTSGEIVATNFPNEIASISTGITPTGTISITQNGTVDVTNYANANVNVSGNTNYFAESYPNESLALIKSIKIQPIINFPSTNTTTESMFSSTKIQQIDLSGYETTNVTNMTNMFLNCSGLISVAMNGKFTTEKVTNMSSMFSGCRELITLNFNSLDFSKVTNIYNCFLNCNKIQNINGSFLNLGQAYTQATTNYTYYRLEINQNGGTLTYNSIINIISGLYDLATAGKNAQTVRLGSSNLSKLTDEEKAIATNKGWNLS